MRSAPPSEVIGSMTRARATRQAGARWHARQDRPTLELNRDQQQAPQHQAIPTSWPHRAPNWARSSGDRASKHGEIETLVAEHGHGGVVGVEREAIDRDSFLRPSSAVNANVARRDVPPAVVDGQAERFALPRHRDRGKHDDQPGVAQPVVDPAGAEHGVLHLDDQGIGGTLERFVSIGERDLQQRAPGGDEVGLHTDATVGIVEAVRADHVERKIGR
jgi:hypothetical protein